MISLSTPIFDPAGALVLDELADSEIHGATRRINRVATLDGGVAVNDRGHTAGDRTFRIRWRVESEAQYGRVQRLIRLHGRVRVATREGVFMGAPEEADQRDGIGTLTILILEQET